MTVEPMWRLKDKAGWARLTWTLHPCQGCQPGKTAGKRQSSWLCSASFCTWVLNGDQHRVQAHMEGVEQHWGSSLQLCCRRCWVAALGMCLPRFFATPADKAGYGDTFMPPLGILTCWLQGSFASGGGRSVCTPTQHQGPLPGWKESQNNYPSLWLH